MRRRIFLLVSCILLVPSSALAQRITGRVLDQVTGEPLPNTVVTLRSEAGVALRHGITSAAGLFSLTPPAPGSFTVLAERVGYESRASATLRVESGASVHVELSIPVRAISMDAVVVTRERTCALRTSAAEVARLWGEVRTALLLSAAAQRDGALTFSGVAFERRVTPDSVVLRQEARPFTLRAQQPYRSLEPAELEAQGYVRRAGSEYEYHAPSPEALLSAEFERTHCFALVRDESGHRTGIAFEPSAARRGAADIAGIVWIDGATARLQSVDFHYTDTTVPYAEHAGGSVEFAMLPNGAWIVSRWTIRTPAVAQLATLGARLQSGRVSELQEVGGAVHRARAGSSDWIVAPPGALGGMVLDSTRMRPLAGAVVHVTGTGLHGTTDETGAFHIRSVPPGSYQLVLSHPRLDSLPIYEREAHTVRVESGAVASLQLAVQPVTSSVIGPCLREQPPYTAVLYGHVRDERGERQPDARVALSFDSLFIAQQVAGTERRTRTVTTDRRGRLWECALPSGRPIDVAITTAAGLAAHTRIWLPEDRTGAGRAHAFHEFVVLEDAGHALRRQAAWRALLGQR